MTERMDSAQDMKPAANESSPRRSKGPRVRTVFLGGILGIAIVAAISFVSSHPDEQNPGGETPATPPENELTSASGPAAPPDELGDLINQLVILDNARFQNQLRGVEPSVAVVSQLLRLKIQVKQLMIKRTISALNARYELSPAVQGKRGRWSDFEIDDEMLQSRRLVLTYTVGSRSCAIVASLGSEPKMDTVRLMDSRGRKLDESYCFTGKQG